MEYKGEHDQAKEVSASQLILQGIQRFISISRMSLGYLFWFLFIYIYTFFYIISPFNSLGTRDLIAKTSTLVFLNSSSFYLYSLNEFLYVTKKIQIQFLLTGDETHKIHFYLFFFFCFKLFYILVQISAKKNIWHFIASSTLFLYILQMTEIKILYVHKFWYECNIFFLCIYKTRIATWGLYYYFFGGYIYYTFHKSAVSRYIRLITQTFRSVASNRNKIKIFYKIYNKGYIYIY